MTPIGSLLLGILAFKPIDNCQDLLNFIPNDVPAGLKGHAVDPLAMRHVRHADARNSREGIVAVHENGNDNLECRFQRDGGQIALPEKHLSAIPVSISGVQSASGSATTRATGCCCGWRSSPSASIPFGICRHRRKDPPADRIGLVPGSLGNFCLFGKPDHNFRRLNSSARIDGSDDLAKSLPVGLYGLQIAISREIVPAPQPLPLRRLPPVSRRR